MSTSTKREAGTLIVMRTGFATAPRGIAMACPLVATKPPAGVMRRVTDEAGALAHSRRLPAAAAVTARVGATADGPAGAEVGASEHAAAASRMAGRSTEVRLRTPARAGRVELPRRYHDGTGIEQSPKKTRSVRLAANGLVAEV